MYNELKKDVNLVDMSIIQQKHYLICAESVKNGFAINIVSSWEQAMRFAQEAFNDIYMYEDDYIDLYDTPFLSEYQLNLNQVTCCNSQYALTNGLYWVNVFPLKSKSQLKEFILERINRNDALADAASEAKLERFYAFFSNKMIFGS